MIDRYLITRNIAGQKIEKLIKFPKSDGTILTLTQLHDDFKAEFRNLEHLVAKHGGHDWSNLRELYNDDEAIKKLKIEAEIGKLFKATILSSKLDDMTKNKIMLKIEPKAADIPDCDEILAMVNRKIINNRSSVFSESYANNI